MIVIDGDEGGGQVLRTALTLSVITGKDLRIKNIRGNRDESGLKNQHLECIKAVRDISDAEVKNLSKGAEDLVFRPGKGLNSSIKSDIGTAGSVNLVIDTVLPLANLMDEKMDVEVSGGTDVKWAPTSLYHEHVKLPLIEETGLKIDYEVKETGFYPVGGGVVSLNAEGKIREKIDLTERGELEKIEIYSKASTDLKDAEVASRQAKKAREKCKGAEPVEIDECIEYVESDSTGSVLLIKAVYENSVAGFDNLGAKGKSSEMVAEEAFQEFKRFHESGACVDRYMADQLMVFGALTDIAFTFPEYTDHMDSNLKVIEAFGYGCEIKEVNSVRAVSFSS